MQDWERFGEEIRRTVQDAVDSQDYRKLNQTITDTINRAVNGAVNGAELPETQHIGQREAAANDRQHSQRQEQRRAHGKPKCGQSIGQHQRRQHARPDHRRGQVFIARLFTVPAAP